MTRKQLVEEIFRKKTYLCVGLDTDPSLLPGQFRSAPDGVFQFNKAIVDATREHCVAYKINTAFYEAQGIRGWEALQQTVDCIPSSHLKIADAKRGDIGNTSAQYARAFFDEMSFDAITVAPYMGRDSLQPFLDRTDKWTIVLGLTSNPGAKDFEMQRMQSGAFLYETVLEDVSRWGSPDHLMFVVGATRGEQFQEIRRIIPDHFLLVPGVGAQGGSLEEISVQAKNDACGLLVNASRAIIYASGGEDFADAARIKSAEYHQQMQSFL